MSRLLVTGALAVASLAVALPARAQTPPEAPPPPQPSQVVVVLPPGYGLGYGGYPQAPPPPAGPYPYYAPMYQPYQPPPPAPEVVKQEGFTMKLWAGAAYRRLFDFSIEAADLGFSFGGERHGMVWSGGLGVLLGRTDQGLPTYQIRPGATWEVHLDRVRLGLGVDFSWLGIERATHGDMITGVSVGGHLSGTVDLVRTGKSALYLGATLSAEWFTTSGSGDAPLMWGPSAMAGFRY